MSGERKLNNDVAVMLAVVPGGSLIGRGAEVELLRGLVAAVVSGTGGVVLVEGEQGIGKTALLREGLSGASAAGCGVGWAQADELGLDVPLGVVLDCLRAGGWVVRWEDVLGSGPLMPSSDPVLAAAERVLAFVDRLCVSGPVVMVAEDLQVADEASVLVWERLCVAAGQLPLLVAGSCWPGPEGGAVARLRQVVMARGGAVIALGPLPPSEAACLVNQVAGGVPGPRLTQLADRAGGNPLYVSGLVETFVRGGHVRVTDGVAELTGDDDPPQVPESLATMIRDRLSSLSELATRTLSCAAVLGIEFSMGDLERVAGLSAAELAGVVAEARQVGLVTGGPLVLGFRHGLIRQVLYEAMPVSVRAALHLLAARAMAQADAPAERVAAHLAATPYLAQSWVPGWVAQAAPSLTYRAPRLAADLLRRLLSELAQDEPGRAAIEAGLVTAAFLLGRYDEVERVGRWVLAMVGEPDQAAGIAWLLAYALLRTNQADEGAAVATGMLARSGLDEPMRARLEGMHSMLLVVLGRLDEAAAAGADALARAERAGDRFGAGFAMHALSGACYGRGDHAGRLEYIERALALTRDDPLASDLYLALLSNQPAALRAIGRWQEAIPAAQQAVVAAERTGYPQRLVRGALAFLYFDAGRWDDALAELELIVGPSGPVYHEQLVRGVMAIVAVHRDDIESARRHLAAVEDVPLQDLSARINAGPLLEARAAVAERSGQIGEAISILAQLLDPAWQDVRGVLVDILPTLTRLALAAGDKATALAATAAAAQTSGGMPQAAAAADRCRGLVDGDPGPLLAAARFYESRCLLIERAKVLEDAAVILARRGEIGAARSAFTEVLDFYEAVRATWGMRRASARLRPFGVRHGRRAGPRSHAVTGWAALTPTETAVARLIAAGGSNPDVAAELMLSRSTVQTHVSHILAKLGARSRAEIVGEALRHPRAHEAVQAG